MYVTCSFIFWIVLFWIVCAQPFYQMLGHHSYHMICACGPRLLWERWGWVCFRSHPGAKNKPTRGFYTKYVILSRKAKSSARSNVRINKPFYKFMDHKKQKWSINLWIICLSWQYVRTSAWLFKTDLIDPPLRTLSAHWNLLKLHSNMGLIVTVILNIWLICLKLPIMFIISVLFVNIQY